MKKVNVVGVSGSGKTTLAKKIAAKFDLQHIELDALHWKEDWSAYDSDEFQRQICELMDAAKNGWVIDGYYGNKQGDRPWGDADTVIFLDIALWRVKLRIAKRSIRLKMKGELVWGTNKERLSHQIDLQKSVNKWHPETKRQMKEFSKDVPVGVAYYHFTSNKQANKWYNSIYED